MPDERLHELQSYVVDDGMTFPDAAQKWVDENPESVAGLGRGVDARTADAVVRERRNLGQSTGPATIETWTDEMINETVQVSSTAGSRSADGTANSRGGTADGRAPRTHTLAAGRRWRFGRGMVFPIVCRGGPGLGGASPDGPLSRTRSGSLWARGSGQRTRRS